MTRPHAPLALALAFLAPLSCTDAKKEPPVEEAPEAAPGTAETKAEATKEDEPKNPDLVAEGTEDPIEGDFTLEQAFEGDATLANKAAGKLTATLTTSMGAFECELFEDKAPLTVANFVGLARGTRPWRDEDAGGWVARPYYDGNLFHRVKKDFMAQTGDHTGAGNGGPGYSLSKDELGLKHKWPGTLSMANLGPGTANSQFFVTAKPTPHLDGKHAVFGKCDPEVVKEITKVKVDPRRNDRPYEKVTLEKVVISRNRT
jgi:peptidyl-prolyl cis-trans isomerase A (cyclophilin A)